VNKSKIYRRAEYDIKKLKAKIPLLKVVDKLNECVVLESLKNKGTL
jgi:hypothetical protein